MTNLIDPARPAPEPPTAATEAAGPGAEGRGHPGRLAGLAALLVFAGVMGGWSLLVMILALVVMIFLHELGHFLTAKSAGMGVTEFFIGFGPRIWSFRRGETEYGLKVIPAGAYVKIIGMHNLDEFDPADADRTYMSKPFWRRLSVAVAGSTMHFIIAAVCFTVAFAFVGLPGGRFVTTESELDDLQANAVWSVDRVSDDSAAAAAGILAGDQILAIDDTEIDGFDQFRDLVIALPGEEVDVLIERDGVQQVVPVEIGTAEGDDGEERGFFGVGPRLENATVPISEVPGRTVAAFGAMVGQTFSGLAHILSPSGLASIGEAAFTSNDAADTAPDGGGSSGSSSSGGGSEPQAAGLVGISAVGSGLLGAGEFGNFLALFAAINIFIGVFNLVPLLPLDGGHVAIACYEKVRSMLQGGRAYHVDVVKLLPVTYAVVMVLAFLGISLLVLDTRTLVGG
jgi:membrane-associated protease RseP (regulator of RpoE activity)